MDLVWKIVLMPLAALAFLAGSMLPAVVAVAWDPTLWPIALLAVAVNILMFFVLAYFYRKPAGWRLLELSATTFLAVLVISYALGLLITIWIWAAIHADWSRETGSAQRSGTIESGRMELPGSSHHNSANISPVFLTRPRRGNIFVTVAVCSSALMADMASSAKTWL